MGNQLSVPQTQLQQQPRHANGADPILGELGGEVVYDKSMGSSRFLKAVRGRHRQGALVVKVFAKPDPSVPLKAFQRRIKSERDALANCPNVQPYGRAVETERAGYLMRQWVASNLYDRISTRPFLSSIEKRWIAFQLLTGLAQARERGVAHGDIKTENVVVTSWNWAYLTDFSSSFKPTYLPLDDPSTFSLYFDTSSRRTCYIAPERFYAADSAIAKKKEGLEFGKRDGRITEEMDVFALGCVLAELWMEGTPPFTLSQLFKYREGEYSVETYLAEIEDVEIRSLIRSMISLDPSARLTFADYLQQYRSTAFPDVFYTFLHPFLASLASSAPPPATAAPRPTGAIGAAGAPEQVQQTLLRTDADETIERVWGEWEVVARYLDEALPVALEAGEELPKTAQPDELFPIRLNLPGHEGEIVAVGEVKEDGPALVILALLSSNLRNCVRPTSVLRALELLVALNRYLTDETRLDRLVPYLVAMLEDDVAAVRSMALRVLTQTLMLTTTLTPSNFDLFPEYILPNTRALASDVELLPREVYALCIPYLAKTARRFLEMGEAMRGQPAGLAEGGLGDFESAAGYAGNFDTRLLELHSQIQEHLSPLLSDSSSSVKRALLTNVSTLCTFFGRLRANDAVLAHLVTYLNTRDWLLRKEWNAAAVDVAACVGSRSLEEYILPLITLSLADPEEFVVVQVLKSLTILAERRLLAKGKIWELVGQINGFLCHPNIWIREADKWCILYPPVKRLLRADIKEFTDLALLDNAREPISRVVFEAAVAWAARSGKSNFWSLSTRPAKGAPRDAGVRTDEDHAQLEKMRQLGMSVEDEYKLSAMREYIAKVAAARQAAPTRDKDSPDSLSPSASHSNLQDLGIVPQTIFFTIRTPDEMLSAARGRLHGVSPLATGESLSRRLSSISAAGSPRTPSSVDLTRPSSSRTVSCAQPIDDLRRRLALGGAGHGGSTTSLHSLTDGNATDSDATMLAASPTRGLGAERMDLHRTVSHASTENSEATSAASTWTATAVASPKRHGVRIGSGVGVELDRVAPAVAQDSTNAMGLFDVEAQYRASMAGEAGHDAASALGEVFSGSLTPGAAAGLRLSTGAGAGKKALPQRFSSTYEGTDPSIKQLLERTYLDSYREPLPELGPHVPSGIPRRKALRTSFAPRERTPSRPEGTLIAHLTEHTGAITSIQVSPDQLFFATGSEDGTVKIWDAMRLEKNVTSRARQTIQQGGKITAVCILEHSHCVASASTNGTVWVHRVDVSLSGQMPRYSKPYVVRQYSVDDMDGYATCLASFNTDTTVNLVLGTSLSSITVLDLRTMRSLHAFDNPHHFGPITALCVDRKHLWLVAATATGVITLWDLRFGLLLRSWSVGAKRVHQLALHPTKGKGRWIVVAMEPEDPPAEAKSRRHQQGTTVAEVWDIDQGVKVEEFRIVSSQQAASSSAAHTNRMNIFAGAEDLSLPVMQEATLDPAAAIEALLAASTAPPAATKPPSPSSAASRPVVKPSVHAILLGSNYGSQASTRPAPAHLAGPETGEGKDAKRDGGFFLTGGEDRKLRFWDLDKASRSAIVSGLDVDEEVPSFSTHSSTICPTLYLESPPPTAPASSSSSSSQSSRSARPSSRVHRSTLIANSQQQMLRAHQDAITALAVIDLPFRCVVSGDRSGVVKVFE
ncbi:Serine/threonine-protein kinase [Rhodosporidiobolus nylandii]